MKIARVKCLKGRLALPSLGVTLLVGQEYEFIATQFQQSVELQKAFRPSKSQYNGETLCLKRNHNSSYYCLWG